MEFLDILALVADVVSILLGITAIVISMNSEKRSKKNFEEIIKINNSINKKLNIVDEELDDLLDNEENV